MSAFVLASAAAQDSKPASPPTSQPATQPADSDSNPPAEGFDAAGSDAKAIELADTVMKKMGGRAAWDHTRYITWNFFGARRHVWDKRTGNVRLESVDRQTSERRVVVFNIHDQQGRAWRDGVAVDDESQLADMIQAGMGAWINDSYWLVMPYKLKDSGVTLKHLGSRAMQDGRDAAVLELTFKDVGNTPQNKYHVYVAKDTSLVEQWDFFATRDDAEPRFQIPWSNWKKHGRILLSGDRGERKLTDIAVLDELPGSVFTDPKLDWDTVMKTAHEVEATP